MRPIDAQEVLDRGKRAYRLVDRMALSDQTLSVPMPLALALNFVRPEHDAAVIAQRVSEQYSVKLTTSEIQALLDALDRVFLLDNARAAQAAAAALARYRALPQRVPICAGGSYPAKPAALARALDGWLAQAEVLPDAPAARGIFSPHIDYARGGKIYASAWHAARLAAQQAECVIVFATDHYFGHQPVTLTRQHYASPLGRLPTDVAVIDALGETLGAGAFEGELFHTVEHSIELPLVWLQHMRGALPPPRLIPILVGGSGRVPTQMLAVLRASMREARTLILASGDLAHVGPAFAGEPLDDAGKAALRETDAGLLALARTGDGAGWHRAIRATRNANNVCGHWPVQLALALLHPAHAESAVYAQCPADDADTSVVSICGMVWE